MYYYLVAPASRSYLGPKSLTFHCSQPLQRGQIVHIDIRNKASVGIVLKLVAKPTFKTSPINNFYAVAIIPEPQLKLLDWLIGYYPGGIGPTASMFTPASLAKQKSPNLQATNNPQPELPKLTLSQSQIINAVSNSTQNSHIIHGDTGTGKTRIYLELAKDAVSNNQSAIILTPEISLTPQLTKEFESLVGCTIFTVHSGLGHAERRNIWTQVLNSKLPVVLIGARSALFYPISNLGLIVVDEFHDSSYKQDQSPKYSAIRVAAKLANISNCKVLFGSATPPIDDYFYATQKGVSVHRLTQRPNSYSGTNLLTFVDLAITENLSKYPLFSNLLLSKIRETLENKKQIMLFLNKRGTSRSIICQNCGWQATCVRCNIPYIYHHDTHKLRCHVCNKKAKTPINCPDCGSEEILFKNPGTKAIFQSLTQIFPDVKIGRYDKDNTKSESFYTNHPDIASGKIDILIGTQQITKGHDLPNLHLVGVLSADSSLNFPDYTAEEKTYQLITQIYGRVGRRQDRGEVIIQTYGKPNKIFNYLGNNTSGWQEFYDYELKSRKQFGFPPYNHLLKILVTNKKESKAEESANQIYNDLYANFKTAEILGPSPAYIYKSLGGFSWQIIIKSKKRSQLIEISKSLPKTCKYDLDPSTLL